MGKPSANKEFHKFFWPRIIGGILVAIALVWAFIIVTDFFRPTTPQSAVKIANIAEAKTSNISLHETPVPAGHESIKKNKASSPPAGVVFIDRLVAPLEYELTKRFWGWRPNDIINLTDNVNNIQLGVLEATRRATIALTDRISRTGSTETLKPNLERAMNDLMVDPESYWFPTPESKYLSAISELRAYQEKLRQKKAPFYIRADNLIPLLKSFEELLGSCDDNLTKQREKDGSYINTFKADDYLYYAKGVAIVIESVLRGVEHDFKKTIENKNGMDIIETAIEDAHTAAEIDPWIIVTEGNLSGIFANHRANMAAPISHTKFYINLLIKALST